MQSRKKVVGAVAAVAALGATGVGVAQNAADETGVEFEAASAQLTYTEQSRTDRPCRNSRDGDFVRFSRWEGTSASDDDELSGTLDLFTATLIEGGTAASGSGDSDGAITVGVATITNDRGTTDTRRDDIFTRFGLGAVDQNNGQDEDENTSGSQDERDRPVTDEEQTLPTGQSRREQDDSGARVFRVEGFGLGRAFGMSSRVLVSNLNLDVAAEEPQGTSRDGSETREGEINTGNDAGNDGLLASGSCDLNGDGRDDFNEGAGFSGSVSGSRD